MRTARNGVEKFRIPRDIILKARGADKKGVRFLVSPVELIRLMRIADRALNEDSNDAEHDALYEIRETLSDIYEDPTRTYLKRHEDDRRELFKGK